MSNIWGAVQRAILELKQEKSYAVLPLLKIAQISKSTFYYVKSRLERPDKYLKEKNLVQEI